MTMDIRSGYSYIKKYKKKKTTWKERGKKDEDQFTTHQILKDKIEINQF